MKQALYIFLILFGFGLSSAYSQTGGKKREGRVKKRGNHVLTQYKSHGHADQFAKGNSGRRGIFARLFKKKPTSWTYRSSGSKRNNFKTNQYLFTRNRTKGKIDNSEISGRQNSMRSKSRVRGNRAFKFKKYKRR